MYVVSPVDSACLVVWVFSREFAEFYHNVRNAQKISESKSIFFVYIMCATVFLRNSILCKIPQDSAELVIWANSVRFRRNGTSRTELPGGNSVSITAISLR